MPFARRLAPWLVALALASLAAAPAGASSETIKRSLSNILMTPLDIVASPIVAGQTIYRNLNDIDDSTAVRLAYPVPGYVWVTGVQIGASVLRGVAGVLEFVPGLALIPFETDMSPLFDPAVDNAALVNFELPLEFQVKFGVDYTGAPF